MLVFFNAQMKEFLTFGCFLFAFPMFFFSSFIHYISILEIVLKLSGSCLWPGGDADDERRDRRRKEFQNQNQKEY